MPSVDDPIHARLVQDVSDYLEGMDYLLGEGTYHEAMPAAMRQRLSRLFTPTSLYVRGRADRTAAHKSADICFLWEAKTNPGRHENVVIEALPLLHHVTLSRAADVDCLYVYRDLGDGFDGGFWSSKVPTIQKILIPDKWGIDLDLFFRRTFRRCFPDVDIRDSRHNSSGSGDPFIVIEKAVRDKEMFDDWKREVSDLTECEVNKARNGQPQLSTP